MPPRLPERTRDKRSWRSRSSLANSVTSRRMTRTSGRVALALAGVKYFLADGGLVAVMAIPFFPNNGPREEGRGLRSGGAAAPGPDYFLAAGAGSGGLIHTGSTCSFEAATATGLSDAWPQATSTGSLAKSTTQPSRL